MEIKPQELRIGNLLDRNGIMEVLGIGANNKLVIYDHYNKERLPYGLDVESFKGIDLTPEWLDKFGFKVHHEDNTSIEYWIGHNPITRDYLFMLCQLKGSELEIFYRNGFFRLRYVHQLQNLYWCLCGQELKIDKP